MEIEKIMKLVEAGFTREEILNFTGGKPMERAAEKPMEKPAENSAEKPAENSAEKHAENQAEKPNENEALNNILQEMKNVVQEIQKANIFRASLPGPGDGDNVDSILASIINPRKENN